MLTYFIYKKTFIGKFMECETGALHKNEHVKRNISCLCTLARSREKGVLRVETKMPFPFSRT